MGRGLRSLSRQGPAISGALTSPRQVGPDWGKDFYTLRKDHNQVGISRAVFCRAPARRSIFPLTVYFGSAPPGSSTLKGHRLRTSKCILWKDRWACRSAFPQFTVVYDGGAQHLPALWHAPMALP